MLHVNWKTVGGCTKALGKGIAYGALLILACGTKIKIERTYNSCNPVGYYDAVNSIMESNMLDSYKREIVEMIKPDSNSDYYNSVISVLESNMLDSYKRDTIKTLSEK